MTDIPTPEWSHMIDRRNIPKGVIPISANQQQCADLAKRFDLESIDSLSANLEFHPDPDHRTAQSIILKGKFTAKYQQICAISAEILHQKAQESFALFMVEDSAYTAMVEKNEQDEEGFILSLDELDIIPFKSSAIDIGEMTAQSFALSIDPYATGENCHAVRQKWLGEEKRENPFAILQKLQNKK